MCCLCPVVLVSAHCHYCRPLFVLRLCKQCSHDLHSHFQLLTRPVEVPSFSPFNPLAESLLHSLKMFDRFISNGRTQWNCSGALNSSRSSQTYFGRFFYLRHWAKAQGGDIIVGGWKMKQLPLTKLCAVPHVKISTHAPMHFSLLSALTWRALHCFPGGKRKLITRAVTVTTSY